MFTAVSYTHLDLVRKRHGINLNFGHDGVLMAILTNLQAGTWAREASNSKEALQSWKSVSYTHLDVYKRQAPCRDNGFRLRQSF